MDCRSTPEKNSGYAAWKLELCSSSAYNGPTTRITALAGLADLSQDSHSGKRWLIYKTLKNSQEAAEAMQQLDSVSQWCHDTGSLINPDKAQTLWCIFDNRAAGKPVPAVTFDGTLVERTRHLRHLGIHFDAMLTYRKYVETTALKCKKRSVSHESYGCRGY